MADEKDNKPVMTGAFSVDDLTNLLTKMAETNSDALKAFATELAFKIAHPDPTDKEIERAERSREAYIQLVKEQEEIRRRKRQTCPHRRIGPQWGIMNGTSTIAWHITNPTYKDQWNMSQERPPTAFGVCMWCHSEFKPGDADYAEKLSWGIQPSAGTYQMNIRTGVWQ